MNSTTRIVAALAAIALLAGCQSSTESTASEGTTQLAEAGALPVTVDHAYGSTTIETEPQRIVTIGWNSQDSVLALGKTPVAMESFSGAGLENGILPWDEELLGDVEPTLLDSTSGVPFEQILALEPDVIIAVVSGITEDDYARLSQIAPTIPFKETAWATTWQEQLSTIGSVLGQPKRAAELIEETDDSIADLAAGSPNLNGKTLTFLSGNIDGLTNYCADDGRVILMSQLGLKQSAGSAELCGDTQGSVTASREQYNELDADVIVLNDASGQGLPGLMGDKLFADLPAVKDGRLIQQLGLARVMALASPTSLSVKYAFAELVSKMNGF